MNSTIKKISSILLVIGLILFNACSNNDGLGFEPEPEPEPVEKTDEPPVWNISQNQTNYEFNMTYSSQIAFNGKTSANTATMISAFVGNECRGISKLIHEQGINIYIFNLTIYSNEPSGENITIRAYDPDKKILYNKCISFKFESDDVKGSIDDILNCISE